MKVLVTLLIVILATEYSNGQTNNVFCFYSSWAVYRPGLARFGPEDIDINRCTHVTYSFIGLRDDGQVNVLDSWADEQLSEYKLRNRNPHLKVLVSMGGWAEGSERYSRVVNNPVTRAEMVRSVHDFVRGWGFDGFDFDWEYPAEEGGHPNDYYTYIDFLRELRGRFGNNYIMTAAVGNYPSLIGRSYNVPAMNQILDYINLMTYDYHGSRNGQTGQNSPLYASSQDLNRNLNIHATVQNWIRHGASRQKIFLGLGFYGQSYTLSNANNNGLGAPTTGPGNTGPYSGPGQLMHLEICEFIRNGGWTVQLDWEQMSPYMFRGNQWIGYDNAESIRIKTRYAVDNGLGGVMIWAVDHDDHRNRCGEGTFPLLRAIRDVF